jgi:protein-S-isoprenylcysteine O-methyltransferase Ste14
MRMRVSYHEEGAALEAKLLARLVVRCTLWFGAMGAVLFAAAGDPGWPQGWAFIGIFVLGSIGFSLWLMRRDPALLASRLEVTQEGQAAWDRVFLLAFIGLWFVWLAAMALDARRFRLSHMPVWANVLGGALIVAGFLATMPVFLANSFAAPVVRIQEERGQRVIDGGPYAIVRHPMYAAAILYLVGMPFLLGSWVGLLFVPLYAAGVAPRALAEERLLARELAGYADYMRRVRWRIIPGVW